MSAVLKPSGVADAAASPGEIPNPFVGPNPIPEKAELFARDKERGDLVDLLIAERFVLLFGPTGAGKTSLINAGLIPDITAQRVRCLPVVKLEPVPVPEGVNPYLACLYQRLFAVEAGQALPEQLENAFFEQLAKFEGRRVLVIIDTLEQIFTNAAHTDKSAIGFLRVLEILHSEYSNLMLLVAMREEFIGRLEGLARPVRPGGRLRLGPLRGDRAREAIIKTAARAKLTLTETCVGPVVRQLAEFAAVETKGDQLVCATDDNATWHTSHHITQKRESTVVLSPIEQLFVEPLYLQLTCFLNWRKLVDVARRYEANPAAADSADISVGDTIEAYVESVIVDTAKLHAGMKERTLRVFLAEHMVASSGELDSVRETEALSRFGIELPVLLTLDERKLIRREPRNMRNEWELSHFLIAKAVRHNYLNWCLTKLHPLQMRARRWARNHEDRLLLKKAELAEMRTWLADHPELTNDDDNKLVAASQKVLTSRKLGWRNIVLMSGIGTLAVIAGLGVLGTSRLYRHSYEMNKFQKDLDATFEKLKTLRTDLEDRARIASRFGELGDLVSARPEAEHAIEDMRLFRATKDPDQDPRNNMNFVTKAYRRLAIAMSYKKIVEQADNVDKALESLKSKRSEFEAPAALADRASMRLLDKLADQYAPRPLDKLQFETPATLTPHGTIVAGVAATRAGIQVLAPAKGELLVVRARRSYSRLALPKLVAETLDILGLATIPPAIRGTFQVNGVFLAPQTSDNPTLFVRSARRDYLRVRQNAGTWQKPAYFQVFEAEDADVKASTIVANKEWGVCLVRVGGVDGRMTLMAGEPRRDAMCANDVFVAPQLSNGEPAISREADLIEVSPNGRFAFVGGANAPGALFALDSRERYAIPAVFNGKLRYIVGAKFDDDEQRLALADKDGAIYVFDLPAIVPDQGSMQMGRVTRIETRGGQATSLAFVGADQLVASTVGRELEHIDLKSGRVDRVLSGFDVSPTFVIASNAEPAQIAAGAPDGKLLYWSVDALNREDPTLDFSAAPGKPCGANPKCRVTAGDIGNASAVSISPDLEHVAVGLDDGRILRIAVSTRSLAGFYGPAKPWVLGPVTRLAFSPDGRRLAAAHARGELRVHDAASKKTIEVGTHTQVTGLAFIDDQTLVSAGLDQRRGYFELKPDGSVVAEFHPKTTPRDDRSMQWNSLSFDPRTNSLVATRNDGATLFTPNEWREDTPPPTVTDQYGLDPPSDHIFTSHRFGELLVDGSADGIQRVHTLKLPAPASMQASTSTSTSTPTTIIGGRRDWVVRQYFDITGRLMFAIDGNGTLRVTDTLHRRIIAAIDLPMARDANAVGDTEKLFSGDMHVVCRPRPNLPPTRQNCVIALTLGVDQTRIGLIRLGK